MRTEFKIRNFTTEISASRTITEIEDILRIAGCNAIMKSYRGDGRTEAISFKLNGRGYMLPSNTEKGYEIIRQIPEYKNKPKQWLEEQAERVVWRVIKDWLDSQMSLIRIGQAEIEQVMLPYMWDGRTSLYERIKEGGFALPSSEQKG